MSSNFWLKSSHCDWIHTGYIAAQESMFWEDVVNFENLDDVYTTALKKVNPELVWDIQELIR